MRLSNRLNLHRKLCSTDPEDLLAVANQPSVGWERCDTCGRRSHDQL
jgi:hypothetical protein